MPIKITLWLEKGKPTRVRTTKADEFYLEDLTKMFEEITRDKKGAGDVAGKKKNCSSAKR